MDGIITNTVNIYIHTFNGYFSQFLQWGKEFFFTSVIITVVWLCLWNAFDKSSFNESMPKFIKEFFIITLFYTIMIYANDWLITIPNSASFMGKTLTGLKVDPSSIIDQGINLTNFLANNVNPSGILEKIYAAFILAIATVLIMFAFISIALDLAVTTLAIYFFIAISGFALAFSVFDFTRSIARKTLDVVIANSVKLLSMYLVIAAGNSVFTTIVNDLKSTSNPFDVLGWVVAAAFLFWLVAKNIPNQVAKVFSDVVQETRGTDAAALAISAVNTAQTAVNAAKLAGNAVKTAGAIAGSAVGAAGSALGNIAKITGSAVGNAHAHFKAASGGLGSKLGSAAGGGLKDLAGSAFGSLTDQAKHLGSKLTGGKGMVNEKGDKSIPNIAQRMQAKTASLKGCGTGAGTPSSAGREAASPSSNRSAGGGGSSDNVSKPRTVHSKK